VRVRGRRCKRVHVCLCWCVTDGSEAQRTDVAESHEILKEKLKKEADIGEISAHAHTDEDINELIARTPEEIILFNQMDEDEKKEAEKRNRKSAQTPLPRLMADHEVPQWMQVSFHIVCRCSWRVSRANVTDPLAGCLLLSFFYFVNFYSSFSQQPVGQNAP